MKVKICGMKYLKNIQEVASLKPDLMGFIFYPPSPRYVDAYSLKTSLTIFPEGIKKVGVFVNEPVDKVQMISGLLELDYVQLHGGETPDQCRQLQQVGIRVIKVFHVDNKFDMQRLQAFEPFVDYFLFDTKTRHYGGSGRQFDWKLLTAYPSSIPFFLSGGISEKDVQMIRSLNLPGLAGIDANSQLELAPGQKDALKVEKLITQIRS